MVCTCREPGKPSLRPAGITCAQELQSHLDSPPHLTTSAGLRWGAHVIQKSRCGKHGLVERRLRPHLREPRYSDKTSKRRGKSSSRGRCLSPSTGRMPVFECQHNFLVFKRRRVLKYAFDGFHRSVQGSCRFPPFSRISHKSGPNSFKRSRVAECSKESCQYLGNTPMVTEFLKVFTRSRGGCCCATDHSMSTRSRSIPFLSIIALYTVHNSNSAE